MKLIDITQELFTCHVYPGDPQPERNQIQFTDKGDMCNLTRFSMCAHNGTHVDAPYHFIGSGKTIDQLGVHPYVGDCYVARYDGDVTEEVMSSILSRAQSAGAAERILIGGDATMTEEGAKVLSDAGVLLFGNESQTVGPLMSPAAVHMILLGNCVTLLEGVVLKDVPEGVYFLSAAPLNLGGADGAPCRAYLISKDD